ncbi:DHS-like NAD/FAD-binding domain-containing protein [Diaporthe sp. PMI_573]|nr:DHS-like NAD/FAD-binding domain-containing protein [Diaporthaceae sp. PMI_573]
MWTCIGPSSERELSVIARQVHVTSKGIMITGAGISTAAGIPDFLSRAGLYADLFSENALRDGASRRQLQKSALELYQVARSKKPTRLHGLIKELSNRGKLLRCYTQNIDMLEAKAGLSTDLNRPGVECVLLHGSLRLLRCSHCSLTFPLGAYEAELSAEDDLPCSECVAYSAAREAKGRRRVSVGILLPDVVRIGQQFHTSGEVIAKISQQDRAAGPDFLFIVGTQLKRDGPKNLVKMFVREIKKKGGMVVYVNLTKPQALWRGLVDYWVKWDCDEWANDLAQRLFMLRIKRQIYCSSLGSSPEHPILID